MASKEIAQQAKTFLYELNDARHEYSFESTDQWSFNPSTAKEKLALEGRFYPVLFTKCDPADLGDLTSFFNKDENDSQEKNSKIISKDRIYLVAYCSNKLK